PTPPPRHHRNLAGAHVVRGNPFASMLRLQQGTAERHVKTVTSLVKHDFAQHGTARKVEIANGIEDLVSHELILETQAFRVEDAALVDDNRVLKRSAARQTHRPQRFDLMQEAER